LTAHHEQLSRALEDGTALELDLSGITRIDTAGLQLVLAFVLEMKRQGREISTVAASEVVSQSVRSAGVGALLGL
jgi:ABC-type transporter Mla MlaB component